MDLYEVKAIHGQRFFGKLTKIKKIAIQSIFIDISILFPVGAATIYKNEQNKT